METPSPVEPGSVAELALGRPVGAAAIERRTSVAYDPYLPGRSVERVDGVARLADGETGSWSAIVKRTEGPGLRAARRELDAYRLGIADARPVSGLRAPRLLGWHEAPETVELWLEVLADGHGGRWTSGRFGAAARHIAAADARLRDLDVPAMFDSEDAWAERHGQPERLDEALAELHHVRRAGDARALAQLVGDPGFRRTEDLIVTTPARIARLGALPTTLMHHDLVRSNLFALGPDSTGAIDWENVGRGPLGVDLAPLVSGSVRRGEASADDLPALERRVLEGYGSGLRAAGIEPDAGIRRAFRLAIGLRWHVVLGTLRSWLDPTSWGMRGSRRDEPRDESLRHLLALTRYILDTGEPA
ncbi:MAG TPA: phosphotransferase [Candidatus Limnocylindrales bacterium]|nr:phosphotransferase [Candidatus Limnocylindrales bacterium]